jgi:propanol-preferring alcohol dehydrogenase
MACAGITAYNAVKKAEPSPGDVIMIIGVGGLGHIAIQIVRKLYGTQIIAVDIGDEALELVETLGTDYIINPSKADVREEVRKIAGGIGVDAAIDFVGVEGTFSKALKALKRGWETYSSGARRGIHKHEAEIHRLEEINEVFERLGKGLVRGRAVIAS